MMDYVALGFLMYRPLSMYEIKKAMERSTRHFLSASFGSLHPTLRRLETRGLVTSDEQSANGRRKKIFSITEAGRAQLVSWLAEGIPADRVSDPSLLRLFFLGHLAPAQRAELLGRFLEAMEQAAETLVALRAEVMSTPVPRGAEDHMAYQLATLEFGIAHHRFVKDWYQTKLAALAGAAT